MTNGSQVLEDANIFLGVQNDLGLGSLAIDQKVNRQFYGFTFPGYLHNKLRILKFAHIPMKNDVEWIGAELIHDRNVVRESVSYQSDFIGLS